MTLEIIYEILKYSINTQSNNLYKEYKLYLLNEKDDYKNIIQYHIKKIIELEHPELLEEDENKIKEVLRPKIKKLGKTLLTFEFVNNFRDKTNKVITHRNNLKDDISKIKNVKDHMRSTDEFQILIKKIEYLFSIRDSIKKTIAQLYYNQFDAEDIANMLQISKFEVEEYIKTLKETNIF